VSVQEQSGELVPSIRNILDKEVMKKVLEANGYLERNDEEGAKRVVCEMIRLGFVQIIPMSELSSGIITKDKEIQ